MNYPQLNLAQEQGSKARIKTNRGEVLIQLFSDQAPKTVQNFIGLANEHYYDGTIFHRVIPDFMIQGGDPTGNGMGGKSFFGEPFADEFSPQLFNVRGALSMANAGPNTNGSQFFIVQSTNLPEQLNEQMRNAGYPEEIINLYQKGGTPWLDFHHTVFGQVISGLDIVDEIAAVQTGSQDKPITDITIESVNIE